MRDGIRLGAIRARVDKYGCTSLRQRERDGAADIATGTCDNCNTSTEFFRHIAYLASFRADSPPKPM